MCAWVSSDLGLFFGGGGLAFQIASFPQCVGFTMHFELVMTCIHSPTLSLRIPAFNRFPEYTITQSFCLSYALAAV